MDAHQDEKKLWWQMSLAEQLNCVCDSLAKLAVRESMHIKAKSAEPRFLPREKAAIVIDNHKLTTDAGPEVRYALGESDVRRFYTAAKKDRGGGLGWSETRFNQVARRHIDACLEGKPDMYGIWVCKQASGVCASRKNMSRIQDTLDNKCPNCGMVERAEHLTRCPSEARTELLEN